jgi:hypothetical protein
VSGNNQGIVNHIAILLDKSGSMQPLASGVIKQYNDQAKQISSQAASNQQKTHLSLYAFAYAAEQPILVEVPLDLVELRPLDKNTYDPNGGTAMLDSIGLAVDQLSRFERGTNDSFLIIVITDGEENQSKNFSWERISTIVRQKISTDAWTFVFLVPVGAKRKLLERLNVFDGNVQEWDQTAKGVEAYSKATNVGINNFFAARASGKRSVKSFFTDLSGVSTREVAANLVEITGDFKKAVVTAADITGTDQHDNETVVIQEFCEKHFHQYVIGNACYELMKREKVQDHKSFVIEDRTSGKMYGGPQARTMLGFPPVGEVSVAPGDHGKFRIYVKSTSVNRKLVKGSTVLYRV